MAARVRQSMGTRSSRRAFLKGCGVSAMALIAGACAPTPTQQPAQATAVPQATAQPAQATTAPKPTAQPTAAPKPADPTPKLDKISIMINHGDKTLPTPRENNIYWQEIEKRVGCEINFIFGTTQEYTAKVNAILASGELPDVLSLREQGWFSTLVQAAQAGAFLKIQDLGLPKDKRNYPGLFDTPDYAWKNSALNGVYYALPNAAPRYSRCTFIRKDWAGKLGLAEPKTEKDLKAMFEAFGKKDPDGNGKDDTRALTVAAGRYSMETFLQPFGVPNGWKVKSNGTLEHQDVSVEMQAAIAFYREVYELGVLNPDFPAMSGNLPRAEFEKGVTGGLYGNIAAVPGSYLPNLQKVVPTADLYALTPPSATGAKGVTYWQSGVANISLLNRKYVKDQNAAWDVVRVLDFWTDPANFDFLYYGFEGTHHTVNKDGSKTLTERGNSDIQWIYGAGPRPYERYQTAPFVTPAVFKKIQEWTDSLSKLAVDNPIYGLWPDLGDNDPSADLTKFATTTFEQMIRGQQPISAFDTYAQEWYKRGGRKLTDAWTEAFQKAGGKA